MTGSVTPGVLGRILHDHGDPVYDFALAVTDSPEAAAGVVREAVPAAIGQHGARPTRAALLNSVLAAPVRRHPGGAALSGELLEPGHGSGEELQRVGREAARSLPTHTRRILDLLLRQGLEGETPGEALEVAPGQVSAATKTALEAADHLIGSVVLVRLARADRPARGRLVAEWTPDAGAARPVRVRAPARDFRSPTAAGGHLEVPEDGLDVGSGATTAVLELANTGVETLEFSGVPGSTWLRTEPVAGTVAPGERVDVAVVVDQEQAPEGAVGEVRLRSSGGTTVVPVRTGIERPPALSGLVATPEATVRQGCPGAGPVMVRVSVVEESGVDRELYHRGRRGGEQVTGMARDGASWTGAFGPFDRPGTVRWWVTAVDIRVTRPPRPRPW